MNESIKVLTIPELSKLSGVSQFTLRKLCHDGRLPYLEIGNRWLIKLADFDRLFRTTGGQYERTGQNEKCTEIN